MCLNYMYIYTIDMNTVIINICGTEECATADSRLSIHPCMHVYLRIIIVLHIINGIWITVVPCCLGTTTLYIHVHC